jgi:hypothetical protein
MLELEFKNYIVNEKNSTKGLNTIKVFDKNNKLINDATIIKGDLDSIKCYVGY